MRDFRLSPRRCQLQTRTPKLVYTYNKLIHILAQLCGRHPGYKIRSLDTLEHNEKL